MARGYVATKHIFVVEASSSTEAEPAAIRPLQLPSVVGYEDSSNEAMMIGRGEKFGIAVRLFAAFALVFLSFAHKPVVARHASPATSAEYLLPDGTFADICFGTDGVGHDAGHGKAPAMAPVCEACRLAASILLPGPPEESGPVENGSWLAAPLAIAAQVTFAPRRLLPPPRGPPVSA